MDDKLKLALLAYAFWYPRRRTTAMGQAYVELSCGHIGQLGAPICKKCADKLIDETLENIK